MLKRSYHTTDLTQKTHWELGCNLRVGIKERETQRQTDRQTEQEPSLWWQGTFKGHLLTGDDVAAGTESLKAGWGSAWFLTTDRDSYGCSSGSSTPCLGLSVTWGILLQCLAFSSHVENLLEIMVRLLVPINNVRCLYCLLSLSYENPVLTHSKFMVPHAYRTLTGFCMPLAPLVCDLLHIGPSVTSMLTSLPRRHAT